MSLVAYDYSSDEDSGQEETDPVPSTVVNKNENGSVQLEQESESTSEPTNEINKVIQEEPTNHLHLPTPKIFTLNGVSVEEEDDEFLRKKAVPIEKPTPLIPLTKAIHSKVKNGKVQISIPSLNDFSIDETKDKPKPKAIIGAELPNRTTGLLNMLPKPKSEMAFPIHSTVPGTGQSKSAFNMLVPDSVTQRSKNAKQPPKKPLQKPTVSSKLDNKESDDSDGDDDEKLDFFSFNNDEKLPEISTNEINAMVAKRAARMAKAAKDFEELSNPQEEMQPGPSASQSNPALYTHESEQNLASDRAISSLIGGNKAKRAKLDEVQIIDINSSDIVPNEEDFMRRKLMDETGFVATGNLTGDWTCTSKRKSHITYLASKAMENAQELEAMWSANRQSRRQTQSKYGF
ncbi:proline-rich protein PRCC [Uranotaenia lowii]|uniref:proline-rich protein PRCC n=1 Tax=Uranotaenia lowii TaxID=190385 RepID=UPI002479DD19|nr:proline-rich protein PRCC [Uranotaenia lowii]